MIGARGETNERKVRTPSASLLLPSPTDSVSVPGLYCQWPIVPSPPLLRPSISSLLTPPPPDLIHSSSFHPLVLSGSAAVD